MTEFNFHNRSSHTQEIVIISWVLVQTYGLNGEQLSNLVKILNFFAKWAKSQTFSSFKVEFHDSFKVFSHNIILFVHYAFVAEKNWKTSLAGVKKCEQFDQLGLQNCDNLWEIQFHVEIFRRWIIYFFHGNQSSVEKLVHEPFRNFGS